MNIPITVQDRHTVMPTINEELTRTVIIGVGPISNNLNDLE